MARKSKKDLISRFTTSLSDDQLKMLDEIAGRTLSTSRLQYFLGKAFRKPISVSARKSKSRRLQQWVANKISEITGIPWGKDEEIASREMGQSGVDIRMSPRVRKIFPWSFECKDDQQLSIKNAVEQAKSNIYPGTDWVVIAQMTGPSGDQKMDTIAILDAEIFFEMASSYKPKLLRRR